MDYHDRGCRKTSYHHDSHGDVHHHHHHTKYKMVSPKCDQCDYHDLKRKSSNSSLENIVLKLKKSRHDDKDTRHFSPQVIEKFSSDSHYKSPPTITMCTRIDRGVEHSLPVERSMHSHERNRERRLSSDERIERERTISSLERRISPPSKRSMPLVERSVSSLERRHSPIERRHSPIERRHSPIERSIERHHSPIERNMSSIERNTHERMSHERRLSPVERRMSSVERRLSPVERSHSSLERTMSLERKLSPVERNILERNPSSYERSIERHHDLPPRGLYSSEKYLDKYTSNRGGSPPRESTVLSEINESNEKSSFVTLLEQQDDIQYASTLSMASILGSSRLAKNQELEDPPHIKRERERSNSPIDVTSSVQSNPSSVGDDKSNIQLNYTDGDNSDTGATKVDDASDKIAETKCDKCHKRFYRKSQLIRHISNHVVHECHKCNAFFYCVRKFKKHMSTHESYPCEFCEEEFYEASAWYHHRAKHTMVECSSCDMIFYNKTALLKHKFTHLQYICPVCRFPFSNLNHWISHRSCHKTFGSTLLTPLFSCRECSTTFPSQDTYMKHTCLHRQKKTSRGESHRPIMSKRDISDLIGVDQTAK